MGEQDEKSREALARSRCGPCEGGVPPLDEAQADAYLKSVPQWQRVGQAIERTFTFKNFLRTMSFVNAVAWVANLEDHHPDMEVSYKTCKVRFSTHSIGGLSTNDFICAAKVDALLPDA